MNPQDAAFLNEVETLAGPLRAKTFRAAAEWVLGQDCKYLVETGCYRGIPADGQSTVILGLLAKRIKAGFVSCEISEDHIAQAKAHVAKFDLTVGVDVGFCHGDSVETLGCLQAVDFIYLDSYDCDVNHPQPSQLHQLAEIGAVYGKLRRPCAILMDDCFGPHRGKTGLSRPFLLQRDWKMLHEGYQLLFVKET